MKPGLFCSLLLLLPLPACSFFGSSADPEVREYVLTWYCISPDGCEHEDEAVLIDRASGSGADFYFTSSQNVSFRVEALRIFSQSLPYGCSWLYDLSFFGQALERSRLCSTAGGFELDLSIPNEDPATHSQWVVSGRDVRFL